MRLKIGVISLGCAKNRVDTETLLGVLAGEYDFVAEVEQADVLIINTCAFVNDAKEESIHTILEAEEQKKAGKLKGIIVTGCLPQRFQQELQELIPSVDAYLGVAAYKDIKKALEAIDHGSKYVNFENAAPPEHFLPRLITTQPPTAYLKISEGCNNCCAYCVIPSIRGPLRSRKTEDILSEMITLTQNGFNEIVLVAQDTTMYGVDIYGESRIVDLVARAALTPGLKWLRLLYCYPEHITEELIDVMLKYDTVVPYIDMPVQHFDDAVLESMNRKNTCASTEKLVSMIRRKSEDFILRTTLIAGLPGETQQAAAKNCDMLKKLEFDRVGVFAYSQEESTKAAYMDYQIAEEEKLRRRDELMAIQAEISLRKNQARIGKTYEVLVEGYDPQSRCYFGRSYAEAPDADGKILIDSAQPLTAGTYYPVTIRQAFYYDLKGEIEAK